jgi:hypothetical protein
MFIPKGDGRKRFEVRSDLLYTDTEGSSPPAPAE